MTVDTKKYIEFVYGVTSAPSQDSDVLQEKISELVLGGADVSHLLTAALGLTAESGEFTEIVKKILLQGKPYNEENIFHMKRSWEISVGILHRLVWHLIQPLMKSLK
tara:strand:+ start:689 stop:1009 length:321 start_codon:yes stop_codon:yes gene_type:complete